MSDIEPPDDPDDFDGNLPDEESLSTSLRKALDNTPRLPRDRAAVRLAMHYAGLLDDAFDRLTETGEDGDNLANFNRMAALIAKIGPRYEATLDKLGMTPGARPAARGGDPAGVSPAASWLAFLQSGGTPPGFDPGTSVDPSVTAADVDD